MFISTNCFRRQPHKIVKHSIHRQQPTNCLSVFDHFVGMVLKGFKGVKDSGIVICTPDGNIYNFVRHWLTHFWLIFTFYTPPKPLVFWYL